MPQFTLSERWLHPEGTFPAQLVEWSEVAGQFGPRIKWIFETNQEKDDGTPGQLHFFTGLNISPRSKLGKLIEALGGTLPETVDDANSFDPEALVGNVCRLRIIHAPGSDGTEWANIDEIFPAKKREAAPATAAATTKPAGKSSPVAEGAEHDPFADGQ